MLGYCEKDIIKKVNDVLAKGVDSFYQNSFLNYSSKTIDTHEYYVEVIARQLQGKFASATFRTITRTNSYNITTHDGSALKNDSNRVEEKIAMEMFKQSWIPGLGNVLNYQIPKKNKQTDKAGKIDLLVYNRSKKLLYLLELKKPRSKETMLRCALESYTYLRTIDQAKLLADFGLPADTQIQATPFVAFKKFQYKEMMEGAGRPEVKKLMDELGCVPIYYKKQYIV